MKYTRKLNYKWLLLFLFCYISNAEAAEVLRFDSGWKFYLGDKGQEAIQPGYNDSDWRTLDLPHDWSIEGAYEQTANGTDWQSGFLPAGIGWYRKTFSYDPDWNGKKVRIQFDGVYLNSEVWINGHSLGKRPNGYIGFEYDLTPYLKTGDNCIAVKVDQSKPLTGRWYTGSGIYRHVYLHVSSPVHIGYSGVYFNVDTFLPDKAVCSVDVSIVNPAEEMVQVVSCLLDKSGQTVARSSGIGNVVSGDKVEMEVIDPERWLPDNPFVYTLVCQLKKGETVVDEVRQPVGFRSLAFSPEFGFKLNGKVVKLKGVCDHHTAGAVGAAVPEDVLYYRLKLLKEMGCNAIRTAHNPFSPEFYTMCDTTGLMVLNEGLDGWNTPKAADDYSNYFEEWWEKDMTAFIKRDRNHPSVIMWSIGNEVPTQCSPVGYKVASFLQDICHREDPTRPVTCGMDQVSCVLKNGFAAMIDVPGFNYRAHRYLEAYELLPQNIVLGSETSSTVSSRGVYKFPVEKRGDAKYDDHQSSGYDLEHCSWSNVPDEDFALADDYDWTIGQFVWTGFDYLGEPSPYDTDAWPSHSSLFGIIDLASLPKDRYYLYRSLWNKNVNTLHVLPHWTWPGREGENTPVFVYTNYPAAELFVNGKSYGKQHKLAAEESKAIQGKDALALQRRYRLMWMDVPYEPGEVKVVAYDASGKIAEEKVVRTAGKPHHLEVVADRSHLTADGKDLAYVTVRVVDKDGNLCPSDSRLVNFTVKGAGHYRAAANGDATSLDLFHLPKMPAFSGQLTAIVQTAEQAGEIVFEAKAKGVKSGKLTLYSSK